MSKKFPDLNKDGKITKADVLIGRGVMQANDGKIIDLMSKKFDKILDTGFKTEILRTQDELKKGIDTFAESKTQNGKLGEPVKIPKKENTKILKTVKDTVKDIDFLPLERKIVGSIPSFASKALGLAGYFVPSQMGSSGFKKKTPIY
jgi:hypothetical protein